MQPIFKIYFISNFLYFFFIKPQTSLKMNDKIKLFKFYFDLARLMIITFSERWAPFVTFFPFTNHEHVRKPQIFNAQNNGVSRRTDLRTDALLCSDVLTNYLYRSVRFVACHAWALESWGVGEKRWKSLFSAAPAKLDFGRARSRRDPPLS